MALYLNRYIPPPVVIKLFIFVGLVWASLVGPFTSVIILVEIGASNPQIGVFMAVSAIISMVFQPMWGFLSDKIGSPRRVVCFCLGGSAIFFGCLMFTNSFYVAAGFLIIDIFFRCGIIALLDSHTIAEIKVIPGLQYGHIRMAGSVFFGSLSLIFSRVINLRGVMAIIPISVGIAAFAVIWGLFLVKDHRKSIVNAGEDVNRPKPNLKKDAASLFRNKPYIMLIIFVALSALAVSPLFVFMIEYVTVIGGGPGHVPMIHALRCVVEIPVFITVSAFGRRVTAKRLMLAGACLTMMYIAGLLFAGSFFWFAASHVVFGAPGFILSLTGRLRYINDVTPESVRSTSITVLSTAEIGLGAIVGNLTAGMVLGVFGTRALTMVSLCAIFAAIVLILFLPTKPVKDGDDAVGENA